METDAHTQEDTKRIRRRLDTFVGTMAYHCAQGEVDTEAFGERFHGIIASAVTPEAVHELTRQALTNMPAPEAMPDFKDAVVEACAVEKVQQYFQLRQELSLWQPISGGSNPETLGDLVQAWAARTGQDFAHFWERLSPKLLPLVKDWQSKTGRLGLGDEEVFQHRQEAAEFMASFANLLIAETPSVNLTNAIRSAMQTMVETPVDELGKALDDLLGDASEFTAWETNRLLCATLEANLEVRAALSTPEVAALVEYEEEKQGWGGDADKAVDLLEGSLAVELEEHTKGGHIKVLLLNTLKSVGRRSLLRNLTDAVRGHLRGRLIEAAMRWWLRKGERQELNLTYRLKDGERTPVWNGFWKDIWRR